MSPHQSPFALLVGNSPTYGGFPRIGLLGKPLHLTLLLVVFTLVILSNVLKLETRVEPIKGQFEQELKLAMNHNDLISMTQTIQKYINFTILKKIYIFNIPIYDFKLLKT